jgi:outer membrane protein assembly factor BamB
MPCSLALLFSAFALLPQGGGDWPQFRGPRHDGTTAEQSFRSTGRERPLWRASVGQGYASPAIQGGRLVTSGYDADRGEDRIVCLDASSGEEIWRFVYESADKPMFHEGGTLSTPAIRDGLVYCAHRDGVLRVLSLDDGALRWSKDYASELGLARPFHGFSASPFFHGNRLILQMVGTLMVADAESGEMLWRSEDHGDRSYSNPEIVELDGRTVVVAVLGMAFVVHDLSTGELLGEAPWELQGNAVHCATPLVVGNRVFVSTAYNKGCAMFELDADGKPQLAWSHRRMRNKVTSCVRLGDFLYGFDESMLRCADLEGGVRWRVRGLGLGSLTRAGDRLLILSSDGELIVAEADPDEFRELSRRKVLDGGVFWTAPVLVDGLVYVRNSHGDLVCLDHRATGPDVATDPSADQPELAEVPTAAELFAQHARTAGLENVPEDRAIRLSGTWEVVLRGLPPSPMTLALVAPDRWRLDLDEGGLSYGFDGSTTWAIEPQGVRLVEGEEREELVALLALRELVAPRCPDEAVTDRRPQRFAERRCWRVTAPIEGVPDGVTVFWFDVETGALVGTEGTGRSTLVYGARRVFEGVALPTTITRYRAEDGQEHVLRVEAATWVEPSTELVALPASVRRLMRTPEELAAAEAELRERFASWLGTYHDDAWDMDVEVRIADGSLQMVPGDGRESLSIDVDSGKDGVYRVFGPPFRVSFGDVKNGRATTATLYFGPGPDADRSVMRRVPAPDGGK